MDHDRYGLDGMPIYPRPGHFDHVTGVRLPTFRGKSKTMGRWPAIVLVALMVIVGIALASASHLFG
ncbi:hypothetical protein NJ75_04228 [Novosphingobium subterraneum]|jgi:hypothetical protein|uniref:Uncharacterized protein n=1 Tax=Novosphingobium subterraneum TaxID=48936 RepID=A0A0B8ZH12_9SPHN|nr:hypothetical protein NJ75_04228 [Novosphingobium subterraneum]